MNLQAQRDLSIAGDVFGRDNINITGGPDELPTAIRYDGLVQRFLEYYVGTKDRQTRAFWWSRG